MDKIYHQLTDMLKLQKISQQVFNFSEEDTGGLDSQNVWIKLTSDDIILMGHTTITVKICALCVIACNDNKHYLNSKWGILP